MASRKSSSSSRSPRARASSSTKKLKDPHGGLTAAGRKRFAQTEGAHLKPGVKKKESEMSPEEMRRKGSFLRRHYGRKKPFALTDKKGEPTRYALQAQAWGERLPKTAADIERMAAKGHKLLEKAEKAKALKPGAKRTSTTKSRTTSKPKLSPARHPSRAKMKRRTQRATT